MHFEIASFLPTLPWSRTPLPTSALSRTHTSTHKRAQTYALKHTYTYANAHIHTHKLKRTHAHTRIHTHTQVAVLPAAAHLPGHPHCSGGTQGLEFCAQQRATQSLSGILTDIITYTHTRTHARAQTHKHTCTPGMYLYIQSHQTIAVVHAWLSYVYLHLLACARKSQWRASLSNSYITKSVRMLSLPILHLISI